MTEALIACGLVFGLAMHQCGKEGSFAPFWGAWGPIIAVVLLSAWLAHSSL
jgi:hypothetical protein